MRTTLDLDDELMAKLLRGTGAKTKTAAVEAAIREYVRRLGIEDLIAAAGTLDLAYDWRKEERRELQRMRRIHGRRRRR